MLEVKDLTVSFHTYAGEVQALRGVDFTVEDGGVRWGERMRQIGDCPECHAAPQAGYSGL